MHDVSNAASSPSLAPAIPPATFVAVRQSSTRSVVRLVFLVSLFVSLGLLLYAMWRGAPLTPVSMALTMVVCMLVALATPWKVIVTLGADGLRLRGAILPGAEFLPYRRLVRADVDGAVVWLALETGKRIGLRFPRRSRHLAVDLANRLGEAMAANRSLQHPFAAVLGRGGRSFSDWWSALAGRSADAAYREIAIPRAALLTTIEDTDAPADVRLGAAVALSRLGLDDIGRARVRVASQLTRDPKLRIGLDRAAADDEDAVAAAVDEFCEGHR